MSRFISRRFLLLVAPIFVFYLFLWVIHPKGYPEIGQSQEQCRSLLGEPWLEVRIGTCTCEYYTLPRWKDMFGDEHEMTGQVELNSFRELPDEYKAHQFLFDKDGKLIAFNWIGEALHVETIAGPRKGNFDVLAEEIAAWCDCEAGVRVRKQ